MTTQNIISDSYRGIREVAETIVMPLTRLTFRRMPATTKVPKWVRRLVFRMALKRAYISFASYYPQWAASLFDEHFLYYSQTALLTGYMQEGRLPQASELALAWDAQLGPASPAVRVRRIKEITPVIADFLDWLSLELATSPFSGK